jgi:hypothetical protein
MLALVLLVVLPCVCLVILPFGQSTAALPFGTIVIIMIIWGLVTIPLTIFGGIAGKNNKQDFAAPCRTNKYPREIPELPFYR